MRLAALFAVLCAEIAAAADDAPPLIGDGFLPTPSPTPAIVYHEPTAILMARLSGNLPLPRADDPARVLHARASLTPHPPTRFSLTRHLLPRLNDRPGAAYNATVGTCLAAPHMGFPGLASFRRYDNGEFLAFTAVDAARRSIYLVFRGTASTEQLVHDLQSATHTPFLAGTPAACRASNYFKGAAEAHYGAIRANVTALLAAHPGYPLFITGHSLGGAMASLTSLMLVVHGAVSSQRARLYTFGQPRTGDYAFAQQVNARVPHAYRVVYRADPVPHTPQCKSALSTDPLKPLGECVAATSPFDPLWAYHFGTEVWYGPYGLLHSGSGMPDMRFGRREDDPRAAKLPAAPTMCTGFPFGEDRECSNSLANSAGGVGINGLDHLAYFAPEHSAVKMSQVCTNRVEFKTLGARVASTIFGMLLSLSLSFVCFCCIGGWCIRRTKVRAKKRRDDKQNPTLGLVGEAKKRRDNANQAKTKDNPLGLDKKTLKLVAKGRAAASSARNV